MSAEILHLVRAHKLRRVHAGGGVDGENITVHVVPLAGVEQWLEDEAKAGKWIEPRVYMGLWFASREASG
jgi:ADP-ribose pyrophosphatase